MGINIRMSGSLVDDTISLSSFHQVIKFKAKGVSIDMLFCSLHYSHLPVSCDVHMEVMCGDWNSVVLNSPLLSLPCGL